MEDRVAICGRAETELEVLFKFFTRWSIELSKFDTWTSVRDPETSVDGANPRGTCVEPTESRGVRDFMGPEAVEGAFYPCGFGRTAAETLKDKVSDTVSGAKRAYVWGRGARIPYRSLAVA